MPSGTAPGYCNSDPRRSHLFPSPGDLLPDIELTTPQGEVQRLSEVLTGPTLLIFLRHLA